MRETILLGAMLVLGLCMALALLRAAIGPRVTDRMVAVNAFSTMLMALLMVLALYLKADYLLDVALIYAMVSFLGNVILTRILIVKRRSQKEFEQAVLEQAKREDKR